MLQSEIKNGAQQHAVPTQSNASQDNNLGFESITVAHLLQEYGAYISPVEVDELHASITTTFDVLFHSMKRQIESGVGNLDRRESVRTLLKRILCGMSSGKSGDVAVAVEARRNSVTVTFFQREDWSVTVRLELIWLGRNGVHLSMVECHATINVPDQVRERCAAWFTGQRTRLENHFSKRLATAPARQRAEAA